MRPTPPPPPPPPVPYDAQIEYLESSGTQYIDTGYIPNSNTSVEINYNMLATEAAVCLLGSRLSSSAKSYCVWGYVEGKIRWDYYESFISIVYGPNAIFERWTNTQKIRRRNYVNDTEYDMSRESSFVCDYNALLFCMSNNGNAGFFISAKIAYCKIWDNDILVRDFIPVRVGQVGYMYDRVSEQLFGNGGTGDFILGPDID